MIVVNSISGATIDKDAMSRNPVITQEVELSTNRPKDYALIQNPIALRRIIEQALNNVALIPKIFYPAHVELSYDSDHPTADGMYKVSMTVTWFDETKTTVSKQLTDNFDLYNAFVWCLAKKIFGGTNTVKNVVNKELGGKEVVDYITMNYITDETSDKEVTNHAYDA